MEGRTLEASKCTPGLEMAMLKLVPATAG